MTDDDLPTADDVRGILKIDIVERLRERTALRFMGDCKCGKCQLVPRLLVDEASDEIERMRNDTQMLWDAVAEKNTEIERLRAALAEEKENALYWRLAWEKISQ